MKHMRLCRYFSVLLHHHRVFRPGAWLHPVGASRGCRNHQVIKEGARFFRLLVGKPEGKRPLGRPRRRWIDNIKMDLLEIGWNVVDWIGLAQDR
jgi:hypothetical protein